MTSIVNTTKGHPNNRSGGSFPPLNDTGTTQPSWNPSRFDVEWDIYIEIGILGLMVLLGSIGNVKVMWTFCKMKSLFARQIMCLFVALAIGDGLICSVRVPLMVYGLLRPTWDNGSYVCTAMHVTTAILGIVILQNLLVALQRLIIMYSFPFYRRHFTIRTVLMIVLSIWTIQVGAFVVIAFSFDTKPSYDLDGVCTIISSKGEATWYILGAVNVIPITFTSLCHAWIVYKICSTGLTKLDRIDERYSYVRINVAAISRTMLMLVCWVPYLLANMVDSEQEVMAPRIHRYLDYLLCAQSVISPFITLQDSDFSDSLNKKKCYVHDANKHSGFRRSLKRYISNITSGELRTNRASD